MTRQEINDIILVLKRIFQGDANMSLNMVQISVFGYYAEIQPTPDNISALMSQLSGFMPTTFQNININPISGKVEKFQRIRMNNNDAGWRIEMLPERINIVHTADSTVSTENDKDRLVGEGITYLEGALNALKSTRKFLRLAVNAQYVKPIGRRIPTIPFVDSLPGYIESTEELCEWNLMLNKKGKFDSNGDETTNEIFTCNLASIQEDPSQHAIITIIDINTMQDNLNERFNIEDLKDFCRYALGRWNDMLTGISGVVEI